MFVHLLCLLAVVLGAAPGCLLDQKSLGMCRPYPFLRALLSNAYSYFPPP